MLPDFGITLVRMVNDPRVLTERKVFLAAVIANVASPINLMPEAYLGPSRIADDDVVAVFALHKLSTEANRNFAETPGLRRQRGRRRRTRFRRR
jgi:uncharacterized membrane protein YkvA (DUF1232 family)